LEGTWPREASWKPSSQTNSARRQLCQAKGAWASLLIPSPHPAGTQDKGKGVWHLPASLRDGLFGIAASSLSDCVLAYPKLPQIHAPL